MDRKTMAKRKPTTGSLKAALIRAFDQHGHRYNCSAARGMERDCTCGWLEVRELVEKIRPPDKARA